MAQNNLGLGVGSSFFSGTLSYVLEPYAPKHLRTSCRQEKLPKFSPNLFKIQPYEHCVYKCEAPPPAPLLHPCRLALESILVSSVALWVFSKLVLFEC